MHWHILDITLRYISTHYSPAIAWDPFTERFPLAVTFIDGLQDFTIHCYDGGVIPSNVMAEAQDRLMVIYNIGPWEMVTYVDFGEQILYMHMYL